MTELTQDLSLAQARSLMDSYAFDLGRDNVEKLIEYWLDLYQANWIRLATIEALYLGRYKAISIEHILNVWLRLGTPNPHFSYEFERLICRKLPKHLSDLSNLTADTVRTRSNSSNNSNRTKSDTLVAARPLVENVATATLEKEGLNLERAFDRSSSSSNTLMSNWGISYNSTKWSELTKGTKNNPSVYSLPDVSSFFARLKTFGEEKE